MVRWLLLVILALTCAPPAYAQDSGCDPANGWPIGTTCTPGTRVGVETSPGVAKSVQQAIDDGDFAGAGSAAVPSSTFAGLGSSPCVENPGQTCRVTDSESCSALDPLEGGDLPAYCRFEPGGWVAWPGGVAAFSPDASPSADHPSFNAEVAANPDVAANTAARHAPTVDTNTNSTTECLVAGEVLRQDGSCAVPGDMLKVDYDNDLDGTVDEAEGVANGGIDSMSNFASGIKSGLGTKLATVTTPGAAGECTQWDATGRVEGSGAPCGSSSPPTDFSNANDLDAAGNVVPNSVALGTDTTGNYAGSASEGGPATTSVALAADGTNCPAGAAARGVDAQGNAEECFTPAGGDEVPVTTEILEGKGDGDAQGSGLSRVGTILQGITGLFRSANSWFDFDESTDTACFDLNEDGTCEAFISGTLTPTDQAVYLIDGCFDRDNCTRAELQAGLNGVCNGTTDQSGAVTVVPDSIADISDGQGLDIGVGGNCYGMHLIGYGGGPGSSSQEKSKLNFITTFTSGEAGIQTGGCLGCSIRNLGIDGNNLANFVGIRIGPNGDVGGVISNLIIDTVSIRSPDIPSGSATEGSGTGIWLEGTSATPTNDQIDSVTIVNSDVGRVDRGYYSNSVQATNITILNSDFSAFDSIGLELERGFLYAASISFAGESTGATATAEIYVHAEFHELVVNDLYTETRNGDVVVLEAGAMRGNRSFYGGRWALKHDPDSTSAVARYSNGKFLNADGAYGKVITVHAALEVDTAGYQGDVLIDPGDNSVAVNWQVSAVGSTGADDPSVVVYYIGRRVEVLNNAYGIIGDAATEKTLGILSTLDYPLGVNHAGGWPTYFVKSTGSDSNTGGYFDPFATSDKAKTEARGVGCHWRIVHLDNLTGAVNDVAYDDFDPVGSFPGELCGIVEGVRKDPEDYVVLNASATGSDPTSGGVLRVSSSDPNAGQVIFARLKLGGNWDTSDLIDCSGNSWLTAIGVDLSAPLITGATDNAITSHDDCFLSAYNWRAARSSGTGPPVAITHDSSAFVFGVGNLLAQNDDVGGRQHVTVTSGTPDGSPTLTLVGPTIDGTATVNSVRGIELGGGPSQVATIRMARTLIRDIGGGGAESMRMQSDGAGESTRYYGYGNSFASGAFQTQVGIIATTFGVGANAVLYSRGDAFQLNSGKLLSFVSGYDCAAGSILDMQEGAYDEQPAPTLLTWDGTDSAGQSTPAGCTSFFGDAVSQDVGGASEGRPFRQSSPLIQLQVGSPAAGALAPNYHDIDPAPGNLQTTVPQLYVLPLPFRQIAFDNSRAGAR